VFPCFCFRCAAFRLLLFCSFTAHQRFNLQYAANFVQTTKQYNYNKTKH
jgi:hypothetical protein